MVKRAQRIEPGPGQESVWDYPRPPRVESCDEHIRVIYNGVTIVDSKNAFRVLETSHPPVYYIPPQDVQMQFFSPTNRMTFCEYKGAASYYTLNVNGRIEENVAWTYKNPTPGFRGIDGCIALYPGRMDACYVDDELVQAQEGDFYGGWITSKIVGPFKGAPGTLGW